MPLRTIIELMLNVPSLGQCKDFTLSNNRLSISHADQRVKDVKACTHDARQRAFVAFSSRYTRYRKQSTVQCPSHGLMIIMLEIGLSIDTNGRHWAFMHIFLGARRLMAMLYILFVAAQLGKSNIDGLYDD